MRESATRRIIDARFEATQRFSTLKRREGETVILLWNPSGYRSPSFVGSNYVGSGPNLSAAMDSLTKKPEGHGEAITSSLLDYGSVLFVGDGNYHLKEVICRSRRDLAGANTGLLNELKHIFRVEDLNLRVVWKSAPGGAGKTTTLAELLGNLA